MEYLPIKRHEMSDEQWSALEPPLPVNDGRGRRGMDHRTVINGILWVLNTGAAWHDLPERFGSWQTIYHRFNLWRSSMRSAFQRSADVLEGARIVSYVTRATATGQSRNTSPPRIGWVIPTRSNQKHSRSFDRTANCRRNIIEHLIGWLKEYRSIGTRMRSGQ